MKCFLAYRQLNRLQGRALVQTGRVTADTNCVKGLWSRLPPIRTAIRWVPLNPYRILEMHAMTRMVARMHEIIHTEHRHTGTHI